MVIKTKNPALRKKVFKEMRDLDRRAIKAYKRGDMKTGRKLEKLSDNIYSKNYNKMFDVITRKKRVRK
ncbi:hypothetical protein KAT51_00865 [bacterium]|nr:hypothetical protein [bacterium]